jgi:predicted component of type VI protein secretion system
MEGCLPDKLEIGTVMFGELHPVGGGDPIPLLKKNLLVGRRESCDIVLRFANVSSHHCELYISDGFWYVRDLNSRNGVKVNGNQVMEKRIDPGDVLSVAKHGYEVKYSPVDLGAVGPPPPDVPTAVIFSQSLLERAGLVGRRSSKDKAPPASRDRGAPSRYDITKDEPGKIRTNKISDDPV